VDVPSLILKKCEGFLVFNCFGGTNISIEFEVLLEVATLWNVVH
jgi:hypothetical protein